MCKWCAYAIRHKMYKQIANSYGRHDGHATTCVCIGCVAKINAPSKHPITSPFDTRVCSSQNENGETGFIFALKDL